MIKAKVYLAARYSRRAELLGYVTELARRGFHVTSRWLAGDHQAPDATEDAAAMNLKVKWAQEDLQDIEEADILIAFTEKPRSDATRGGRHVELGYALAAGKAVVVIGPIENVFCALCNAHDYSWGPAALDAISAIEVMPYGGRE